MESLVAAVLAFDGPLAGQQNSATGINFYSLDREIAAGRKVAADLAVSLAVVPRCAAGCLDGTAGQVADAIGRPAFHLQLHAV